MCCSALDWKRRGPRNSRHGELGTRTLFKPAGYFDNSQLRCILVASADATTFPLSGRVTEQGPGSIRHPAKEAVCLRQFLPRERVWQLRAM
jgi:hypothetical protein